MDKKWGLSILLMITVALNAMVFIACDTKARDVKNDVVASVDQDKVTVRDVREFFGVRNGVYPLENVDLARKKEGLDRIISGKLLAMESRNRGYDKNKEFAEKVGNGLRDVYITALFRIKVDPKVQVTKGKIEEESKKIREKNTNLKEAESRVQARENLYKQEFSKQDNVLVEEVKKSSQATLDNDLIGKIVSGKKVADDAAVAKAGEVNITYGEVKKALAGIGGQHGTSALFKDARAIKMIVERISVQHGLYELARKDKVDQTDLFKKMKRNYEASILINLLIEQDIKSKIKVSEADLKTTYKEHPEMFMKGEEVKARHILVDDEKKALEITEEIKKGGKFGELAKKYSKGPSGKKGGELGYFGKGKMVPAFEQAAFALKVGEISKPVKTRFGYHIIQVTDKKKGEKIPLDKIKDQLKQYLTNMKINEGVTGLVEDLKKKSVIKIDEKVLGSV